MAKKDTKTPTPTSTPSDAPVDQHASATASAPKDAMPETPATTALVPANASALAPATDEGPQDTISANRALAARLPPKYREDVLFLRRPAPEELIELVDGLPAEFRGKMLELVRRTRPKKQGAHSSKTGFAPTQLRLNQGTGNDPARPPKHPPGNFYTTDSRDMGDRINVVVLGFYDGRTLWPPRDQEGAKNPICSSMDRQVGSRYGDCASCPQASKRYNEGGCGRDVTVWCMDQEMTGIYEFKFAKSAIGSGEALTRTLTKADNLWDRYFELRNDEKTEESRRWFITKASPVSDPKKPDAAFTPRELHPLFEALSRMLDADVYFPALAQIYDQSKNATAPENAASVGADDAALLGSGAPDYSKTDNPDL